MHVVADTYPNHIDDELPPDDKVERFIGRIAVPAGQDPVEELDSRLEQLFDADEPEFFEQTDALLESRELRRRLEGSRPLGCRAIIVREFNTFIAKRAEQFWATPSGAELFGEIPPGDIENAMVAYFRTIGAIQMAEGRYRARFRPIANQHAHIYPQVHYIDRLRTHLAPPGTPQSVAAQAAGDLHTIYGMSIQATQRAIRFTPPIQHGTVY